MDLRCGHLTHSPCAPTSLEFGKKRQRCSPSGAHVQLSSKAAPGGATEVSGHAMQSSAAGPDASAAVEYRPAAQSPVQALVVSPAPPYRPASQAMQSMTLAVTETYRPGAQSMQFPSTSEPTVAEYFPAAQSMHSASCSEAAPTVPYVPAMQAVPLHPGLLVLYVPGMHETHLLAVVTQLCSYMPSVLTPSSCQVERTSKLMAEPANTAREHSQAQPRARDIDQHGAGDAHGPGGGRAHTEEKGTS